MAYDIKADFNGQALHRVAYGDMQAWLIINQLSRDGCRDICICTDRCGFPDYR